MSALSAVRRGRVAKPPRILVYGVPGIGKTTFGACAPAPLILSTEDGLGVLDVPNVDLTKGSYTDVMEVLESLRIEDHEFRTVVVDSLDWLEPKIWADTCARNNWPDIEKPGYGKGYVAALEAWRWYSDALNALRDDKGMTVVQIAHSQIKRFDSPEHEPYDRYEIKLQAKASALVLEHSDIVMFANYQVATVKTETGFSKKVTRAVGSGARILHTVERPAFLAKNRYGLPETIDLTWEAFASAMEVPF